MKTKQEWEALWKRTTEIYEDSLKMAGIWKEVNPTWVIETYLMNYPPRMKVEAYKLSTDNRRKTTSHWSESKQDHIHTLTKLRDDELGELTGLVTAFAVEYRLKCKKFISLGTVRYTFWLE